MSTPQADRAAIWARLERVRTAESEMVKALGRDWEVAQSWERERRIAWGIYAEHAPTDLAALLADVERKDATIAAAEARADALAQQVETLRAALAKIAAGKSLTHPDCTLPSDEAIDIAEAALGAQA